MEIKILEKAQLQQMPKIMAACNLTFNIEDLENFISAADSVGFVVITDSTIVGFAYAYHLLRPDGKTMLYLHSIDIAPEYQNQGFGSQLLSYILDYAHARGFSECFVITDKANTRACHLYEKFSAKNDFDDEIVYVFSFDQWQSSPKPEIS